MGNTHSKSTNRNPLLKKSTNQKFKNSVTNFESGAQPLNLDAQKKTKNKKKKKNDLKIFI